MATYPKAIRWKLNVFVLGLAALLFCGCSQQEQPPAVAQAVAVSAQRVVPADTPIVLKFVGQTESSRQVEIRARVEGFLEEIAYKEGTLVQQDQVLFRMDSKPFDAALQQARGELALQQARLETAVANLRRIKPLAARNAVSQKDLDDASGNEKAARAAVLTAQGAVRVAELNLGYTTIKSPVTGLASKTAQQEGSFLTPGSEGLLTYVARLDPIWVSFSISENEMLGYRSQEKKGILKLPPRKDFEVEVVLADGSVFPHRGRISFAEPSLSTETGTFLVRAQLANPNGQLRPGQFVRVRVLGALQPQAVLVPQRAVMEGAKGSFVWVVNAEQKAALRAVVAGRWYHDQWFIDKGLKAGDLVVVDGVMKLRPGVAVQVSEAENGGNSDAAPNDSSAPEPVKGDEQAQLEERLRRLEGVVQSLAEEQNGASPAADAVEGQR
jgi:membrane fusion protein (multidrug efflux system)